MQRKSAELDVMACVHERSNKKGIPSARATSPSGVSESPAMSGLAFEVGQQQQAQEYTLPCPLRRRSQKLLSFAFGRPWKRSPWDSRSIFKESPPSRIFLTSDGLRMGDVLAKEQTPVLMLSQAASVVPRAVKELVFFETACAKAPTTPCLHELAYRRAHCNSALDRASPVEKRLQTVAEDLFPQREDLVIKICSTHVSATQETQNA